MRHAGKRTGRTVAIGLLVAMLMASVFGASLLALPHAGSPTSAAASHGTNLVGASPRPAVSHPGATTATITALNTAATYQLIPFVLEVQITTNAPSVADNASVWLTVVDNTTGTFCAGISGNLTTETGGTFINISLNPVSLGNAKTNCPLIESDPVILNATVLVVDNTTGTPSAATDWTTQITSLIFAPLTASLVTPTGSVGAGNVSLMAIYAAQYLTSVRILVYSAPGSSTVVFNASLQWVNSITPTVGTWYAGTAGTYPYTLTVVTSYQTLSHSGNITVLSAGGGTVYSNSSTWKNSSIFPGVSGAVSGTILLVVGLILGMIVALAVGRSLMRPAAAAPAQAWQGTPAAGANTCSVCGKSFATPEELKDHAKSEHGMS